jgi:hypothetical protein
MAPTSGSPVANLESRPGYSGLPQNNLYLILRNP